MTHITFRWKKGPDDLTPYNEAQPTHALTCSNGMKAKLTRVRARPPLYIGTAYDQNGSTIRGFQIYCSLEDSKRTVEERITEIDKASRQR